MGSGAFEWRPYAGGIHPWWSFPAGGNVPGRVTARALLLGSSTPKVAERRAFTDAEKSVLKASSIINGHLFQPWLSVDLRERFSFSEPFTDPDGLLKLSKKQAQYLCGWGRPSQFIPRGATPKMIGIVSPNAIRQELVTDCSFVSSLCIAASFERRFRKRLITGIIFPQNRSGTPIYNPCGKYMVKLWINGIRKVIIDDLLPVRARGEVTPASLLIHTDPSNWFAS